MSTTEIPTIEPEVGQVYKVSRQRSETHYQLVYVDDQVVLLRCNEAGRDGSNVHRIERRVAFDEQVESGWFEYLPDSDLDLLSFSEMEWSQVDYIGAKTEANLHEEGYKTSVDIQQADDDELLNVDGLGNAGLTNLKEFVR